MLITSFLNSFRQAWPRRLRGNLKRVRGGRHKLPPRYAEFLESRVLLSATVATDQLDYAPGSTAAIFGTGFTIGETVQFQVTRTDGIADYPSGNLPWLVIDGGADDLDGLADGNLATTWFVEDQYAGASLLLTATGLSSSEVATQAFTDASLVTSLVVVTPSPTKVAPAVTANVTESGAGAVRIRGAEYFIDVTGANGAGTAMSASDGSFNTAVENVKKTLTATQFNALSQGTHTIFVHGRDLNNLWSAFASATFVKDTVVPTVSVPDLTTADDLGISNTDNITSKTTPTFAGTAEAGTTVTIFDSTTLLGTATLTGTSWTFTVPALKALINGVHSIKATATDAAGNAATSASLSVTVDTVAPTVLAPDLATADDSGSSNTDNITSRTQPTFSGTAEAGTTVTVLDGATLLGTATLTGTSWTFTVPALKALSNGGHSIVATATDTAGNATTSAALTVTVDTVAPTVSAPDLATADDLGISNTDNITSKTTPTFTGTAEAGTTVTIFDSAILLGTATLTGTAWTFTVPAGSALSDGVHSISATSTDTAGNTTSAALSVTIASVGPTVSTPDLITADDTGFSNIDNFTSVTTPTFTGTASAGSTIQVFDGATLLGSATLVGTAWTFTVPAAKALSNGAHGIFAVASGVAGNSTTSGSLTINIDTVAQAISTPDLITADDSGISNSDNVTFKTTPTFTGSAKAGSTVTLFDGATLLGSATVVGTAYTFAVPANKALSNGAHSITATAIDSVGNSATSFALSITVDTINPTISGSMDRVASATGWFNIATGAPIHSYTASDGTSGLNATSPASGSFTFGEGTGLQHTFTVSDVAGNSASVTVTSVKVDLTAPTINGSLNPTGPAATGWYNIATGAPAYSYSASDSLSGLNGSSPAAGNFTFANGAAQTKTFTVTDAAGNSRSTTSASVNVDTVAPTLSASINSTSGTGWYNLGTGAATVVYVANDATSGVTTPTSFTFGDGVNQSLSAITVFDVAGNSSNSAGAFSGVSQDTVAPTLTASMNAPDVTGWYNINTGEAEVTYSASDALSGVTTPSVFTFGDGANQSLSAITVFDVAGNSSNSAGAFSGISQDTVAPTLSASINSPAATGWYNIATGRAVVTYSTSDATSGVATPSAFTFSDGANQSRSAITVLDAAGNTSNSAGAFSGISQDTVAPTLSASINSPAATGWYNIATGRAVVTYSTSDVMSGVTTPTSITFGDGANQSRSAITVLDAAGNTSNTAGSFSGISQDTVAPTLSASINSPAATGWYNIATGRAVVTYSTSDATSGVTTPSVFAFGDGANQSRSAITVLDAAGNTSNSAGAFSGISQDTVAPTLSASINSPGATGWYNIATGRAVVTYSTSDATSGVTTPTSFTFAEGTNQSRSAITVLDAAGNTSNTAGSFSGISQDTVAPTLSASINSPGVTGWYNIATGRAVVTYSTSDALSGVTTPSVFTFGDGANQSLSAIAVLDAAGNTSNSAGAFSGISQDTVAPTLSASINSPGATGWYNIATGRAVVTYSTSDATSGVTTPTSFTFGDGANQSRSGITVVDAAGNTSNSAGSVSGINQDRVAPTLAITPNGSGVLNTNTITFTFQFSESVADFTVSDVSVSNGFKGAFTAIDGDTYTLVVTPSTEDEVVVGVSVAANAAQDVAANFSAAANASVTSIITRDIVLNFVTTDGNTTLILQYDILTNSVTSALGVRFVKSTDKLLNAGDAVLSDVVIKNASDLTVGSHTVTFTIGATVGSQVQLPGAILTQVDTALDYFLLATIDPTNLINEVDGDSINEDNTAVIVGAYVTPKAIYVHGSETGDAVQLSYPALTTDNITLTINGAISASYSYPYATTTQFRIRTHGGNDAICLLNPDNQIAKPMFEFGGSGNDTLASGQMNDTLNGGDGADTLVACGNVNFTLTNSRLTGLGTDTLACIEAANLTGGADSNTFTVTGWTGTGSFNGGSGISTSILGNVDTIVASKDANFTLTDSSLQTSDGVSVMTLSLSGICRAMLTGGASDNKFNITGWSGTGKLTGGSGTDSVCVVRDANMSLVTKASLTSLSVDGLGLMTLTTIEVANLTGGSSNNIFTLNNWLGAGTITGGGGSDTVAVIATATGANFTLSDSQLIISNGFSMSLVNVGTANLTGGISNNSFTVSDWHGGGSVAGGGGKGIDTVIVAADADITLTNTRLFTTDGLDMTLSGLSVANLIGLLRNHSFVVQGWTGTGTIVDFNGTVTNL